jgi:Spy/CpxP family protein refolding chaperone
VFNKFLTGCLAAGMVASLAAAQGRGARAMGGGTPPDPETMIQMRVSRLATLLTLTDDQKAKATSIFTSAYTASEVPRGSLQSNRESLAAAVKKNDAAAIDTLAITLGNLSGQLTAIESKAEAAFYAILTAEQKAKYDAMPGGGLRAPGGPGRPMGPEGFRAPRSRSPQQQ